MKITSVQLKDFRNIEELSFAPGPGVTVISGKNGQGKTNLLESVWLCTGGKTFRGGGEKDFVPLTDPKKSPLIAMTYEGAGSRQEIEIRFGEKKETYRNKVKLPARSQLAGEFLAIVFSPDDLSLVKSSPAQRRRFLDTAICQMYPAYIGLLRRYQKALVQRNALLKDLKYHPELEELMELYDGTLAQAGEQIEGYRVRFTDRLKEAAYEIYGGISDEREILRITYEPSRNLELSYLDAIRQARRNDLFMRTTTVGIHRDDLVLKLNGSSARLYGSQGQQRSCVLALKLAEARLMQEITGQYPVILLDDVMSELDEGRRRYVLERTKEFQVLITCCEPDEVMGSASGAARFVMEEGRLV